MNSLAADQYEHLDIPGCQTVTIARHTHGGLPSYTELVRLSVFEHLQGNGYGTKAIKRLQSERIKIRVLPVADDEGLKPGAQERLERFYYRLGFRPLSVGSDWMEWKP